MCIIAGDINNENKGVVMSTLKNGTEETRKNHNFNLLQYLDQIEIIAQHVLKKQGYSNSIEINDLKQDGFIGLLDAHKNYNPEMGASFKSYASIRILGTMIDGLRKNGWTPKGVVKMRRDFCHAENKVEQETGRTAKSAEIAAKLGISIDKLHENLVLLDRSYIDSFSENEQTINEEDVVFNNVNVNATTAVQMWDSFNLQFINSTFTWNGENANFDGPTAFVDYSSHSIVYLEESNRYTILEGGLEEIAITPRDQLEARINMYLGENFISEIELKGFSADSIGLACCQAYIKDQERYRNKPFTI